MKIKVRFLLCLLLLNAIVHSASAQNPVITSFNQNGVLVCSNLSPGTTATVAWASSLAGPWQTNWNSLNAVMVGTNGTIQVSVPMFYRVLGVAATTNTTPAGMALIPAGSFTMGDVNDTNEDGDAAPTNIYVSAFYVDTNLVTYAQWQAVYMYATSQGYGFDFPGSGKASNHPAQMMEWFDCVKWCNARSQQAGLTPVYYTDAAFTQIYVRTHTNEVFANWAANGYRLPTEAEWEKAARGGLSGLRFPLGNTISEAQANYFGSTAMFGYDLGPNGYNATYATGVNPYTSPIGSFAANGYGLSDMAGNVFEWCWDWYATDYGQPTQINPTGPSTGSIRVLRGGAWYEYAYNLKCARRQYGDPQDAYNSIGFRCVRAF